MNSWGAGMDVDRVRTFLEIVRSGSFVAAAERLYVTQTNVSARIRTLEDELGRQLFVRNRNGARLTSHGEDFRPYAETFVQVWERARHQLAVPEGRSSLIAIGAELSLWNPILLETLVTLREMEPGFAVRAHVALPDRLMHQVRVGILDLAIMYTPRLEPGLTITPLLDETLILVRCNRHTERADDYVYVDWGAQFAAMHETNYPSKKHTGLYVAHGPLGLRYILRAGGYGYFRKRVVEPFLASGELTIVEDAPEFSYPAYVVSSEGASDTHSIRIAIDAFRNAAVSSNEGAKIERSG